MKRFKRATAIIVSLGLLVGVTSFAGAKQDDFKISERLQSFVQHITEK